MRKAAVVAAVAALTIGVAAPAGAAHPSQARAIAQLKSQVKTLKAQVKTLRNNLALTFVYADCGISVSFNAHKATWDLLNGEAALAATYPSVQAVDDSSCDRLPSGRVATRKISGRSVAPSGILAFRAALRG